MEYTLYNNTVSQIVRMLNHAKNWLQKGIDYTETHQIDQSVMSQYRLRPDMLPLSKQIQIACDIAKGCASRLAELPPPKHEDSEVTLVELIERIDKTLAFLQQVSPEQFEGAEDKTVEVKLPKISLNFKGCHYANQFVLPNLYFHLTIAYGILRYAGVNLGKMDFLGEMTQC